LIFFSSAKAIVLTVEQSIVPRLETVNFLERGEKLWQMIAQATKANREEINKTLIAPPTVK
jgi:hypothetical protein